jgi:rhodanese-related sulfurtransferase
MNPSKNDRYFTWQNDLRILTPRMYCGMATDRNILLVDIRNDSLFNKVNQGVKHDYKHLRNASNFFAARGVEEFEKAFPGKDRHYVIINEFGSNGMDLAVALTKKGYKVSWLLGGYDRWEWFMNNTEDFPCNDMLD